MTACSLDALEGQMADHVRDPMGLLPLHPLEFRILLVRLDRSAHQPSHGCESGPATGDIR